MAGLNDIMASAAAEARNEVKASAIIVFLDSLCLKPSPPFALVSFLKRFPERKRLILATQSKKVMEALTPFKKEVKAVVKLPEVKMTRLGRIKLSIVMCLTEGFIRAGDKVVVLGGIPGEGVSDTLMVIDLSRETDVISTLGVSRGLRRSVKPAVIETVLSIALELASEGREGRTIGAAFVIGDHVKVLELSRPLIMNPFKGYPSASRNILDEAMHETIKEYALMDGAFVIRADGVVMSAGAHLDAALEEEGLMPGLGCRHMAAAGITDVTEAVAITISGSTGIV
ncbi:MAG: DNA integrity scanning protein DisA nucleotide-binding domain protein, partial [Deltaproteobacteria bacterium]|nr:DNA integrity scanning protein DisA nucleotide-binding domain protein [Deltaproteobacteria bacterium]